MNQTNKSPLQQTAPPLYQVNKPYVTASFEIKYHQIIDADGAVVGPIPDFARQPEQLIKLYQAMYLTRQFDHKAILLQRRGQLGTYASSLGQEAIGTAIGYTMQADDVLLPAYREYAAQFLRGVSMTEILLYWGGNEQGMNFQAQKHDFPINIPIASQTSHAVGVAYAMQLRQQARVAVCVLGDGATSKGDFYEAINAAGNWKLPVVFVINNNHWAISLPRQKQSHAKTLAQKAIAAGISGEQVDGNDVIAMQFRLDKALNKARNGHGPSVIEALSYRLGDHTTADDATRYRSKDELEQNWKYEPLSRLHHYLTNMGYWSKHHDQQLEKNTQHLVESAVQEYLNTPAQAPESMFDYLYQSLPESLQEQRQSVIQRHQGHA
jgi:pyruvate dehydrogenase E1 component alpha subunit